MDTKSILNAWKESEDSGSMNNIVGTPVVDDTLLRQIAGGRGGMNNELSSGYFCTVSGECNGGTSCWPWPF
jgi:hypothetical protein